MTLLKQTIIIFAFIIGLLSISPSFTPTSLAAPILKLGSANGDVWDIQYRLKAMGFYTKPLDGQYGTSTKSAVSQFQQAYGIAPDGIAGNQTWNALRRFSLNMPEMEIMARVIYSEARGESYKAQVAVGAVVMNRIQSDQFPNSIKEVVFQPGAFTAVSDGQYWLTPNSTAYLAAIDVVRGWDPSEGSLFYFNPSTATSKWIWSRPQNMRIGNHIFTD